MRQAQTVYSYIAKIQHVKGHQDSKKCITQLSVPSQLNVLMDSLAKDLLEENNSTEGNNFPAHKDSFILPLHNNIIVYQKFKTNLYDVIMNAKAHEYWITEKERYTNEDIPNIAWDAQYKALKTVKGTRQRTLTKWFSGWCATGKNMQRWDLRYSGCCPFCGEANEDKKHIIHCNHPMPKNRWKKLLNEFNAKLIKYKTSFYLRKAIILELRAWREKKQPPNLNFADSNL